MNSRISVFAIAAMLTTATPALSASAKLENYSVSDQPLESVVEDIAMATQVPMAMSEPSGIKVRNWKASGTAPEVIRQLSENFGLLYNFDGAQYELTTARAAITMTVRIEGMGRDAALRIIGRLYPHYAPGSVRHVSLGAGDLIVLRGSKRFTETAEQALKACGTNCSGVRIIRGLTQN